MLESARERHENNTTSKSEETVPSQIRPEVISGLPSQTRPEVMSGLPSQIRPEMMSGSAEEVIAQLMQHGQALRQAMTRTLVEDEVLLLSGRNLAAIDKARGTTDPREDPSNKVSDYLLGKSMTEEEETEALKTLTSLPMLENLLEAAHISNPAETARNPCLKELAIIKDSQTLSPRSKLLGLMSCVRMKFCFLEMNEAGLQKVSPSHRSKEQHGPPPTFFVEYLPPRSFPGQENRSIRLCSRKTAGRMIYFGQQKIHSCDIGDTCKPINISIYYRRLNQRVPTLLGSTRLDWEHVLRPKTLSCEVQLCVLGPSEIDTFGHLTLQLQLGSDKNTKAEELQSKYQSELRFYGVEEVNNSKPRIKQDLIRNLSSSRPAVRMMHSTKPKIPAVPVSEKSHPKLKSELCEEILLLRGLIYITQSKGFTTNKELNLYLKLKTFWLEDEIKSQIQWKAINPNFNLHESAPVFLSPYFLERCRGNHSMLEVWDSDNKLGDKIVGLAKLPLHTFYLAYHNSVVAQKILQFKNPVVSVDHWLSVVHPVSGAQAGELLVLLAFGSDDQIVQLEKARGLREQVVSLQPSLAWQNSPDNSLQKVENDDVKKHILSLSIEKISGFPLFETLPSGDGDCFVEYTFPVKTNKGLLCKNFASNLALCTLEPRFLTQHTHTAMLPVGTSLVRYLSSMLKGDLQFRVWCRFYLPTPRDVIVAQACLRLSDIDKLERRSRRDRNPTHSSMALPLTIAASPETSKLCDRVTGNGHLSVRLNYSIHSEDDTVPKEIDTGSSVSSTGTVDLRSQGCQTENISAKSVVKVSSTQTILQLSDFVESEQSSDAPHLSELPEKTTSLPLVSSVESSPTKRRPMLHLSALVTSMQAVQKELPLATVQSSIEGNCNSVTNQNFSAQASNHASSENTDRSLKSQQLSNNVSTTCKTPENSLHKSSTTKSNDSSKTKISSRSPRSKGMSKLNHQKSFRTHIEVERAVRLPYLPTFMDTLHGMTSVVQPSSYVTVQGDEPGDFLVSPVARHASDPIWDWHCDTRLPGHLLLQENQHLIFKVWQPINCEGMPNLASDSVLGFAAVGLGVLLSGLPQISGWFNILNFAGQCLGQIKLCITPLESLAHYKRLKDCLETRRTRVLVSPPRHLPPPPDPQPAWLEELSRPNIQVFEVPTDPFHDFSKSDLEKTLKEKLSELENISTAIKEKVGKDLHQQETQSATFRPSFDHQLSSRTYSVETDQAKSADEEESSPRSTDSDVVKFLDNIDLETLHRLVEQLNDDTEKTGRCSKPDYVCEPSRRDSSVLCDDLSQATTDPDTPQVSRQAPEGGNPVEKGPTITPTPSETSATTSTSNKLRKRKQDENVETID